MSALLWLGMLAQAGQAGASGETGAVAVAEAEAGGSAEAPPELIVTGRASKLYRVDETVTGKLPTDPLASSQNITVITRELIEDQGARDAQDLYRNISGVSFFSYAGVTARGFRQEEIFYDNLRGDPYAGFAVPQLFNVERIEFLKGPAGMLYGPGAPGGLFNYVTKKPSERFSGEVSAVVGTEKRFGASAEVTGAVLPGLGTRAGLFYETRDTFRFNAGSETLIADGGVGYAFGPARLTLQATHYDQDLPANRLRGVPVDDAGNFLTSRRWNHNEPDDFLRLNSDVVQALLDAEIAPGLRIDAGLRYNDARERQKYHEPRGLFDSDGDGAVDATIREFRDQARREEKWSFGANAIWAADLGPVKNRVLAGYDRFTEDQIFTGRSLRGRNRVVAGLPSPLSLFDPQYGLSDRDTYNLPAFRTTISEQKREGAYILEEATIGPVVAVLGLRHDSFRDDNGGEVFSDDELTYRAGLVFRATPELSLFGQYATSFEPQDASAQDPRAGGPFQPTAGDIYEAGVKTALFNGRLQTTLSAYRIQRTNILQADPNGDADEDGIDDLVAVGEVTSKGIDFDLAADLTRNWVLTLAYSYNDARITGDNGEGGFDNAVGTRFANAPEHKLGFWTRYQFPKLGLAAALGGDYVSERRSLSDQRVKPYMVFDASLIYQTGPWRALVRVDNIFDKTYAASGFIARTGHFPGEPRSVFLEISHLW